MNMPKKPTMKSRMPDTIEMILMVAEGSLQKPPPLPPLAMVTNATESTGDGQYERSLYV